MRWRQILLDEAVNFLRSCLRGISFLTFEHEDSVFRYFRYTFHLLSGLTTEQCLVVPIIGVILVKYWLTCVLTLLVGVDFIAEGKNNDQISRLARRYGVLENRQTVGVFQTRSNFLFENEHCQVNSYIITVLFNPIIIDCLPFISRHVRVIEAHCVNKVEVFEFEHFGLFRAPVRLEYSLEYIVRHSTHSI